MLGTQWRIGMSGPVGLDYNVLFRLLDEAKMTGEDWRSAFDDVRILENAALDAMRSNRT